MSNFRTFSILWHLALGKEIFAQLSSWKKSIFCDSNPRPGQVMRIFFPCNGPFLNHSCLNLSGCTESTFQLVRIPLYFLRENFSPHFQKLSRLACMEDFQLQNLEAKHRFLDISQLFDPSNHRFLRQFFHRFVFLTAKAHKSSGVFFYFWLICFQK